MIRCARVLSALLPALVAACSGAGADGTSDAFFGPALDTTLSAEPRRLAFADLDHDARLDVALVAGARGWVLRGNADGTFQAARALAELGTVGDLVVADFDRDGTPDLAAVGCRAQGCLDAAFSLFYLRGLGDGTFEAAVELEGVLAPRALAAGDVDADGVADLVVGQDAPFVSILRGRAGGVPAAPVQWSSTQFTINYTAMGIETADLDVDGCADVVVLQRGAFAGGATVLRGHCDGTFDAPPVQASAAVIPSWHGIADLDGDGLPDLVLSGGRVGIPGGPGALAVMFGAGGGRFTEPVRPGPFVDARFALGDVDGDGRADLVVREFGASEAAILRVARDAAASTLRRFDPSAPGMPAPSLVDLDGDGRPDLVLASPAGFAVLRNVAPLAR